VSGGFACGGTQRTYRLLIPHTSELLSKVIKQEASMRLQQSVIASVVGLLGLFLCAAAGAGEAPKPTDWGDLFSRPTLLGDWGGTRTLMADKGITFDANVTQIGAGVVDGGTNSAWESGGRGELKGRFDTGKAGLWPGGFLTAELEGNWNKTVDLSTGALMPADTNRVLPLTFGNNVALPELLFTQFVNRYFGVSVGKLETLSPDDPNEFAHGKGDKQFFNLAFNINPVLLMVPYSTLVVGATILPTADPQEASVGFAVLSATGDASKSGFEDMNGAIFSGKGRVRTGFFGLTGHQVVGGCYSNKRYTSIDQRLAAVAEDRLATRDGTWAVYYNFDQFLYETAKDSRKGIGLFARFGAGEGNPIPVQYFYSAGVGAKGLIPGRDLDQFGLGYYYSSISNPTLQVGTVGLSALQDEWGFEAYYNAALTPWLLVTPDIQVIGGAQKKQLQGPNAGSFIDNAVVLGFRLQVLL
jgi:porin